MKYIYFINLFLFGLYLIPYYNFANDIKIEESKINPNNFLEINLNIPFTNPLLDYYVTSSWSNSLSTGIALGLKKLSDLKDHPGMRFLEFYLYAYLNDFINIFVQESIHFRYYKALKGYYQMLPNVRSPYFNIPIFLNTFYIDRIKNFSPHYEKLDSIDSTIKNSFFVYPEVNDYILTVDRKINFDISFQIGSIYQSLDKVEILYEKSIINGYIDWPDTYIFNSNLFYPNFLYIQELLSNKNASLRNYIFLMNEKGIKVSVDQIVFSTIVSSFLNWHFFQNFFLTYLWILKNERKLNVVKFNDIVSTPLILYYPSYEGDFFKITVPILKPFPIFVDLGFGFSSKFIFLIGSKWIIPVNDVFSITPFFRISYTEFKKKLGLHINLKLEFQIFNENNHKLKIFSFISYSEKDLFQEVILKHQLSNYWDISEYQSFYFSLGLSYHFAY